MLKQDLSRLPVFLGLSPEYIDVLDSLFDRIHFAKDTVVFEQGQPAAYLFILASGEVAIRFKPYDGPALVVARIPPGGVFGWSAALSRHAYTSGAVAISDGSAYRISASQLHMVCSKYPDLGTVLMERLASAIAERRVTHSPILDILNNRMDTNGDCTKRSREDERKPQLHN